MSVRRGTLAPAGILPRIVPRIVLNPTGPGEVSTLLMFIAGTDDVTSYGYRIGDAAEILVPAFWNVATADVSLPTGTTTVTVRAFDGTILLGTAATDFTP
ncbi:hypothetical protein GCM10010435_04560 [Winogradskya consettensis]|uniref:Uncharacterized protein n=1 Tax=Winogradskya consettensis TaxID=113560 RepID=A0A919SZ53_9ACTN|nr:hypothetical protein [Actinoplanes consettensis]GIM79683.1 hypothetical protein Aco04nite_66810 [Actinoplanes consettensis]